MGWLVALMLVITCTFGGIQVMGAVNQSDLQIQEASQLAQQAVDSGSGQVTPYQLIQGGTVSFASDQYAIQRAEQRLPHGDAVTSTTCFGSGGNVVCTLDLHFKNRLIGGFYLNGSATVSVSSAIQTKS